MKRDTFERLKKLGIDFDDDFENMMVKPLEKFRERVDEMKIFSIEVLKQEQKQEGFYNFIVKVTVNNDDGQNKVVIQVDDKEFQTYKKVDIYQLNIFYADVNVDFSSIMKEEENFKLTSNLIHLNSNKITDTKSINVKVNRDGDVGETDEKINDINLPKKDDCDTNFRKIASIILKHEGGYIDDPDDKGGKTNKGIAWATWLAYAKSDLNLEPTVENLKKITDEQAITIYKNRYWEPKGFCIIENLKIALMFYDWTITSGGARKEFAKLLENDYNQEIENNSKFGENISKAINNVEDQDQLLIDLTQLRKDYYTSLAYKTNKDGTFKKDENGELIKSGNYKFLKGWLNRVDDCLKIKL